MAASVSNKRRDSLGIRQSFASTFVMDRNHQRQGRSRSPRYQSVSSSNVVADSSQAERSTTNEDAHHSTSPKRSEAAGDRQMNDWRYPRHANTSLKRRSSQRSPSRPRSQQGSQIDGVKEAEAEGDGQKDQSSAEEGAIVSHDSLPRKAPRLSHQYHRKNQSSGTISSEKAASSTANVDWAFKRPVSRMSDSDPTSVSSRLQVSHSRTSSADDATEAKNADEEGNRRYSGQEMEEEQGSNYTWRTEREEQGRREGENGADIKSEASASSSATRLPSFHSMAAPSGPHSSHQRNLTPSPRLPSFASLHPGSNSSYHQQAREQGATSPGFNSNRHTSPRLGVPSITSALSPSLSQTSQSGQQLNPGQAFIHPALAGLPGAGGGAGSKQQPSFVSKLYSMLEDETIEDMISWGPSGTVFSVANPAEFSKVVLPNWFKHSNWQSFVRQLNMYGFHKVNHTYQGTPEEEIQVWEFKHPSFRRGEIQLLNDIKRKSSRHKRQGSLGRSMTNVNDYDGMSGRSPGSATSSPDMPVSQLVPPNIRGGMGVVGPAPSHHHHQQQQQYHHQRQHSSRSMGGGAPGYSRYPEYAHPPPPNPSARHHHGSSSSSVVYGAGPGDTMRLDEQDGGLIASEGAAARMDDLSDRIDAIIRHASYLESQLRSVSDQLYQSQQNEVNLSRHVQHLESQMKVMEDQLSMHQLKRTGSPTSSAIPVAGSSSIPSSTRDLPSRGQIGYPARSPIAAHPSYSSSYTRGPSTGAATTTTTTTITNPHSSSADAYQHLPLPRASSIRRDDIRSPSDKSEKRYRN